MTIEELKQLRQLSRGLSVLYIEDDIVLQKQVGTFLTKLFDTCYQAFDGKDGLAQYLEYKPDIILTSLVLPKKDAVELIIDIRGEDENAKIIIFSIENEDLQFLQTIDMGIVDFVLKPFEINGLFDSLLVGISQKQKENIDPRCIEDLKSIKTKNKKVEFLNYYKGLFIHKLGSLVEVKNNEFTVKVPYSQQLAIRYEAKTIINTMINDKHIETQALKIDKDRGLVTFIGPHYINFKMIKMQQKRVKIDKTFRVGFHLQGSAVEAKVIDISFTSLSIYIDDLQTLVKPNDEIDLNLGIEIASANKMITDKKFVKVFARGKILEKKRYKQGYKILTTLKVQSASQRVLKDYLAQRELEIILEYKNLIRVG